MEDTFGRNIRYLRLSVTELCDLRCRYCMAEEGVCKRGHEELCSFEELRDFTAAAAALGVTKLRVTGGEPLVRRGIVELCAMLRAVPGIEELCLTTNGTRLEQLAAPLKAAGVDRLNISLDTLRPERYREITRTGELENVLRGIEAAERAGFENIKLNCVLLGGMNDDEIGDFVRLTAKKPWQVRFIELMPIGEGKAFQGRDKEELLAVIRKVYPDFKETAEKRGNGPAVYGKVPGFAGYVGFIEALHGKFCSSCNRLRLTSEGFLKPCLYYRRGVDLKALLRGGAGEKELEEALCQAILQKPEAHHFQERDPEREAEDTFMARIGG